MRNDIPEEFLREYSKNKGRYEGAMHRIGSDLNVMIEKLSITSDVKAHLSESRVKTAAELWRYAVDNKISQEKALTAARGIVLFKVVCDFRRDVGEIFEYIQTECELLFDFANYDLTIIDLDKGSYTERVVGVDPGNSNLIEKNSSQLCCGVILLHGRSCTKATQ